MKKVAAIFFIVLFFFNWFGYRLVFDYMQHKSNKQLEALLDNNSYDESQLVELKVPVYLPYLNDKPDYERYNGEIELSGVIYKYVKRKLVNDTLYLMCIPNTKKMHLEIAKDDLFKISNDLLNNNSKKSDNSKSDVFKNLHSEYDDYSFSINTRYPYVGDQNFWLPIKNQHLISSPHISPEQPPDFNKA